MGSGIRLVAGGAADPWFEEKGAGHRTADTRVLPLDMSTSSESAADEPRLANTLRSHKATINCTAFAPDDDKLVSGSDDGSLIFWNLNGEKPNETGLCYKLSGHKSAVNAVDFASDGQFFVSGSRDTTVRLWRLSSCLSKPNEEPVVYKCHGLNVRHVALNSEASQFCTSSDDKTVKVWDANYRNKFLATLLGHNNWVRCAKFCPRSSPLVASTGDDGLILVHDLRCSPKHYPVHSVATSRGKSSSHLTHLDWYPLSDFLIAVAATDASVRLYDMRQGNLVQIYESHEAPVTSLAFHPSGKYLLSSSSDSLLKIYDLLEGRVLFTIQAHVGPVQSVAFSSTGESFVSAGNDRIVYLWTSNLLEEVPQEKQARDTSILSSLCSPRHTALHQTFPKSGMRTTTVSPEDCRPERRRGQRMDDFTPSPFPRPCRTRSVSPAFSTQGDGPKKPSPELKLLQGIVEQISNLTTAVSHIEERLAVVERRIEEKVDRSHMNK